MSSTSSGRQARPVTEPTECRSCKAEVLWAISRAGKRMPVDAVADNRPPPKGGTFVLALVGGEHGSMVFEKFDPARHDAKRNRYTSHFSTCPQAGEWRKSK